mmetsp:Transcript_10088/g.17747  ORF Transcript_10088/g.17747 Transcript_10088/m.17747 type:complete len:225 (-) Transcript_10088:578-1252(-)
MLSAKAGASREAEQPLQSMVPKCLYPHQLYGMLATMSSPFTILQCWKVLCALSDTLSVNTRGDPNVTKVVDSKSPSSTIAWAIADKRPAPREYPTRTTLCSPHTFCISSRRARRIPLYALMKPSKPFPSFLKPTHSLGSTHHPRNLVSHPQMPSSRTVDSTSARMSSLPRSRLSSQSETSSDAVATTQQTSPSLVTCTWSFSKTTGEAKVSASYFSQASSTRVV